MKSVQSYTWSLHPKEGKTPPKKKQKKQTEYKINLDFDVIYTKHILKNNLSFLSTK